LLFVGTLYLGIRVGRGFERNYLCCGIPPRRNAVLSLRQALGLVRFPSQFGQDIWVAEAVFPGRTDGFFLDVGSGDGFEGSNSWALEKRGWRGICVDPVPENMTGRTCQLVMKPVDAVGGQKVKFVHAGEIGGIADYLGRYKTIAERSGTTEMTTTTLGDILREARAPSVVDFMSLDIEGAELEALRGFPFDQHSLGALAVEHNFEEPKRTEIEQLMTSKGYVRARSWMQDDFYLPRARWESMTLGR